MREKINKPADGDCRYVAFYKGKWGDVYADTSYEAQKRAATYWKAKQSRDISVHLCEKNGEQIT